jgi:hypothetical protein
VLYLIKDDVTIDVLDAWMYRSTFFDLDTQLEGVVNRTPLLLFTPGERALAPIG